MEKKSSIIGKGVKWNSRVKNAKFDTSILKSLPVVVGMGLPIVIGVGILLCSKSIPIPPGPTIPPKLPGTI